MEIVAFKTSFLFDTWSRAFEGARHNHDLSWPQRRYFEKDSLGRSSNQQLSENHRTSWASYSYFSVSLRRDVMLPKLYRCCRFGTTYNLLNGELKLKNHWRRLEQHELRWCSVLWFLLWCWCLLWKAFWRRDVPVLSWTFALTALHCQRIYGVYVRTLASSEKRHLRCCIRPKLSYNASETLFLGLVQYGFVVLLWASQVSPQRIVF